MSLPIFLARRFFRSSQQGVSKASSPAIRVATAGIAVGICIILLSLSVIAGFKQEVNGKLTGMAREAVVTDVRGMYSPESFPVPTDSSFCRMVSAVDGVLHVQRYTEKMGILKTKDAFGMIDLKGLSPDYHMDGIRKSMVSGVLPDYGDVKCGNDVVVSESMAHRLHLSVGDRVYAYFFEKNVKTRRFRVAGIYATHVKQYDDHIVLASLATVNRLNGWTKEESSGLEVMLSDDALDNEGLMNLKRLVEGRSWGDGGVYSVVGARENPRIASVYDWLGLMDLNVWLILGLVTLIAAFTMISGLLILILERTNTIGLLKALGARNRVVRRTFLMYASMIVLKGLLVGDVLGVLLIKVQEYKGIVRLNPEDYYVDVVPVVFKWWWLIGTNVLAFVIILGLLVLPSYAVGRVSPARTIKME